MSSTESFSCIELQESPLKSGFYPLATLLPKQCCSVKIPFHALKPGKYIIQANFKYKEGRLEPIVVQTEVEPNIAAELNLGTIMLAFTLTRLSLSFTVGMSNSSD